jgi:O-acetyl-ADP-ribose deacetylase (regulator of RNase III)
MSEFIERITLVKGDITKQAGIDAIVAGIYSDMTLEGSLNAAIRDAAGAEIDKFILEHITKPMTGDAFAMPPFNLPVWHIIYVVQPRWRDGFYHEDVQQLRCFRSAMALAERMKLKSIAFPALGSGKKKFPVPRAARIALQGVVDRASPQFDEVRIVCSRDDTYDAFAERLQALGGKV